MSHSISLPALFQDSQHSLDFPSLEPSLVTSDARLPSPALTETRSKWSRSIGGSRAQSPNIDRRRNAQAERIGTGRRRLLDHIESIIEDRNQRFDLPSAESFDERDSDDEVPRPGSIPPEVLVGTQPSRSISSLTSVPFSPVGVVVS